MKSIFTKEDSKGFDRFAEEIYQIPSLLLMENAGKNAASIINKIINKNSTILILCGNGNNGGDGFVIARHLSNSHKVICYFNGDQNKLSNDALINFQIAKKLNIEFIDDFFDPNFYNLILSANVVVDALVGIGGSNNLKENLIPILNFSNQLKALKIAIDIPTGLDSNTGKADLNTFRSDFTITMQAEKLGMLINSGPEYCGIIKKVNLGTSIKDYHSNTYSIEKSDIKKIIPKRNRNSSKFDYGKTVIFAGSKQYSGAAALCANACIKSGVGIVELFTESKNPNILPEIITNEVSFNDNIPKSERDTIFEKISKSTSIIIGPGLGNASAIKLLCKEIINEFKTTKKIIIDADGLSLIHEINDLNQNIIITPHMGEFSKLIGIDRKEIEKEFLFHAKEFALVKNIIILLKSVPAIITDGENTFINRSGNPSMATAGSGDVLSGIIGGMLSLVKDPLLSTAISAFLHGAAGDRYNKKNSHMSLTASNIIENLKTK